jgi:hypothetical protein
MTVQENYEIPFENEYEWRPALFAIIKDLYTEATLEVLKNYKKEDCDAEWKDDSGLLNFAFNEKIFEKINDVISKNATRLSM